MPTEHKHLCPKCFGHKTCRMDCTIEPDLGLTAQGWPRGAHMNCADCGPDDSRPDDMAELARLTAVELRGRGIIALARNEGVIVWRLSTPRTPDTIPSAVPKGWLMFAVDFDNLGPVGCADVIQAEEAKRAQEWAGDT